MRHTVISLFAITWLAACGSSLPELETLSEQDLPEDVGQRTARPTQQEMEGGFLAQLFGGEDEAVAEAALPAEGLEDTAGDAIAEAEATQPATKRRRGGLLGLLRGGGRGGQTPAQTAALAPQADAATSDTGGGGFLGLGAAKPSAKSEIAFGTVLPYGRLARICGVPARQMGKKIATFPERRAQFTLYDSEPGNIAAHTFYITGFDDGCARQFTASLAVFGSVSMHEQLRYGLPAEVQPYSHTDEAYETLKARVCRVAKRKPCGARISRLERDTVFLSIYERFGSNAKWKNLLLHDGDVLAQDIKGG